MDTEIKAILSVLNQMPNRLKIKSSSYTSTLPIVAKSISQKDKKDLIDWLSSNLGISVVQSKYCGPTVDQQILTDGYDVENYCGASCDRGLNLNRPRKELNITQIRHTNHIHQKVKCLNDILYIVEAQAAIED